MKPILTAYLQDRDSRHEVSRHDNNVNFQALPLNLTTSPLAKHLLISDLFHFLGSGGVHLSCEDEELVSDYVLPKSKKSFCNLATVCDAPCAESCPNNVPFALKLVEDRDFNPLLCDLKVADGLKWGDSELLIDVCRAYRFGRFQVGALKCLVDLENQDEDPNIRWAAQGFTSHKSNTCRKRRHPWARSLDLVSGYLSEQKTLARIRLPRPVKQKSKPPPNTGSEIGVCIIQALLSSQLVGLKLPSGNQTRIWRVCNSSLLDPCPRQRNAAKSQSLSMFATRRRSNQVSPFNSMKNATRSWANHVYPKDLFETRTLKSQCTVQRGNMC